MTASKKILILFIIIIYPLHAQEKNKDFHDAFYSINKESIKKHMEVLGDDSLKGRGTGTIGGEKAADYIREKFDEIGLKRINDGLYFQNIQMHESIPLEESELIFFTDDTSFTLEMNKDYLMLNSGEQTYIPAPADLVFAGYGIVAPEFDYNDYQSIDPSGKIVVILEGEPESDDQSYFNGELATIYSYEEAKLRLAISRGAYGAIIIPNISENKLSWENKLNIHTGGKLTLAYNPTSSFGIIINPETASDILSLAGISLNDIFIDHRNGSIKSFDIPIRISFKEVYKERDFISSNIIGEVEGSSKKEEYIIVSAHYDHLGVAKPVNGDSIYNGVMDNAAGVSALIELSRAFSSIKNTLKRSIIFIALTGEENGLLGSTYYTDNPVVPLSRTAANINIDGVSLFDKVKSFVPIGREYSDLGRFAEEAAEEMGLKISSIPAGFDNENAFYMSDQIAFAMAGIPSLIIMEGLDYESISYEDGKKILINYSENIYHSPFDDLSQKLNYEAALQHVRYLFTLIYNLAQDERTPEWNRDSPFLNIRLQTKAEER